jgi:hypothetical protein
MLSAIFRKDQTTTLLTLFLEPNNLETFHVAMSFFNILNPQATPLLRMIEDPSPQLRAINRFYLLSLFFCIMSAFSGSLFYRAALPNLRKMTQEIGPYLLEHVGEFRLAPEGSPFYLAMLMLFSSTSPLLQRILLGYEFPLWLSLGPPRRHLIAVMSNPVTMGVAGRMLMSGIAYADLGFLSKLTPNTLSFMSAVLSQIYERAVEGSLKISGQLLLPLFEISSVSTHMTLAPLLLPIAKIFRSTDVISDFEDFNFQFELRRILSKLCSCTADKNEFDLYPLRIQALTTLAANEETSLSMIQDANFAETVVKLLSSPDMTILRKTWLFFQEIGKFPRVVSNMMAKDQTAKPITAILKTDNHWVLRRILEFSIHVWTNLGPDASRLFCQAMISAVGRISCICKTRMAMFKDDVSMIRLVERYFEIITELDDSLAEKFLEGLATHISAVPVTGRSRGVTRRLLRSEIATAPPSPPVRLSVI